MFRQLRLRITAITVLIFLVLYSISSVAVFTIVQSSLMRDIDEILLHTASVVPQSNIGQIFRSKDVVGVLSDSSGNLPNIGDSGLQQKFRTIANRNPLKASFTNISVSGSFYRILYTPLPNQGSTKHPQFVLLAEDDTRQVEVLNRLRTVLWGVAVFGICGGTVAGFFLAERILRPIRLAWQRQLEFVANASHELRSPLAAIQTNLGIVMQHTEESVVDNLEWLNNTHKEARRLSKLVQDLLTLARSDAQNSEIHIDPVSLTELLRTVHELYETVAMVNEITLKLDVDDEITVVGDRDRLHQLLVILLDNAFKFTPEKGTITLRLHEIQKGIVLNVEDTGEGISPEHLPRVFDRFYTVDPSRARAKGTGTGLGLSLAKWIVDAHQGDIQITSAGPGRGTTVTVRFPKARKTT